MATRNLTAVEGLRFLLFLGIFVFHCVSNWLPIGWGGGRSFPRYRFFLPDAQICCTGQCANKSRSSIFQTHQAVVPGIYDDSPVFHTGLSAIFRGVEDRCILVYLFSAELPMSI